MSDQPTSDRSIKAAVRPGTSRWYRRYKRPLTWAGGAAAVGVVLYVLMPQGAKEVAPRASAVPSAAYTPPPAAIPPPVQKAIVPVVAQPPLILTTPVTKAIEATSASGEHRPAVYAFAIAPMPDYMKHSIEKTQAVAAAKAAESGIDFKPAKFEGTKSFTIPHPALMLDKWTTIPCILDTAVVTGASGITPFKCHTEVAVESSSHVTLLDPNTVVGGYYQSVVGEGQNRVVMVTADATTPNHVRVKLGGPVADDLGSAGVPGSVDNHWWPRIGGALLLTAADSFMQLAQSEIQKNSQNTNINIGGGGSGGGLSNLASQLLAKTINIPPTISLPQGTRVMLWVTTDIDFSDSYALETK